MDEKFSIITAAGAVCIFALFLNTGQLSAEIHPIWNPTGDVSSLRSSVSSYLSMTDSQLRSQLNTSGRNDAHNIDMVDITYNLALLYHLTKDMDYAHRSAVLLDRYAEVFPDWPKDYGNAYGDGIWTNWFHADLNVARKLAEAYDLIFNCGAFEGIGTGANNRVRDLLVEIIQADFRFRLYTFNYAFWRPLGIVIFGRVLDDPQLTHLGYWFYSKQIHEGYCHDGYWAEGTYSYHHQMTYNYTNPIYKFYFNGYSDPPAYTHEPFDDRWDAVRIDNYDFDALFDLAWKRIRFTCYDTALPNGHWPIMNETEYYGTNRMGEKSYTGSLLLGGIGHAVLAWGTGSAQSQVRFDFSHAIGHHHKDANHLIFYSQGTELVGGTAYRYGNQSWNVSTLNQNLVIVNGQEQKAAYWADWTMSPYVPGSPRTPVQRLRLPTNTNFHNNIILFEPGYQDFKQVQVVEADALNAYDHVATRYQRLLALVHIRGNDVYLADFFRLKGGSQYDWTMHGGHNSYSLSVNLSMNGSSGSFGGIDFNSRAPTDDTWSGTLSYGSVKERFIMAGKPGTTVYQGTGACSISSGGVQDYVVVRRTASGNEEENFLVVHEAYTGSPHVQIIEQLQFDGDDGTAVGIKVILDDGVTDYIIYTLDEEPTYPEHRVNGINNLVIKGRFAHLRLTHGNLTWMKLIQGESLSYGSQTMASSRGDYSYRGHVTQVNRKEAGHSENSFEVNMTLPDNGVLNGKTLIVTWGNGWKWGYTIKAISGNRIITNDEPGFDYNGGEIDMQYFPIPEYLGLKRFPGPVTFLIPGSAMMDAQGNIISTDGLSQPTATITLSDPSPTKAGSHIITLITSLNVVKIPTPVMFEEKDGTTTTIGLTGTVPGSIFTGTFVVDNSVADGIGNFSLLPDALKDEYGNSGNRIISGVSIIIDKTAPGIPTGLTVNNQL